MGVDWIVANVGGHGFYRTHYSGEVFTDCSAHVEQLDDLERYWLVSDTFALVRDARSTRPASSTWPSGSRPSTSGNIVCDHRRVGAR